MKIGLTQLELTQTEKFGDLFLQLPQLTAIDIANLDENQLPEIILYSLEAYLSLPGYREYPALVLANSSENIDTLKQTIQAWRKGAVGVWFLNELPPNLAEKIPKLERFIQQQYILKQLKPLADLQHQLQPKSRFVSSHFTVYAKLLAASQMCGDWIEYWQPDENTLLFFLADVAGHGLISSFLTPWLAASRNRFSSLTHMLAELNHELCKLDVTQHVAMLAGKINIQSNTLEWCNAGHYPPGILALSDQTFTLLSGDSLALGLNPSAKFTINTVDLPAKSHIIFASDGVVELYHGTLENRVAQFIQDFRQGQFSPPEDLNDDIGILDVSLHAN